MKVVPRELSERVFTLKTREECEQWLREVDKAVGGLKWANLGGRDDNVHTVQVATDPAAALVERVTNSIDAVIDLETIRRGETPASPQEAAQKYFGIPKRGVSEMPMTERQKVAEHIRVTNQESGIQEKPTVEISDAGTGQHPVVFPDTLLSLHKGNKKSKMHQMGVYNAGSAATYAFSPYTIIASRSAPDILPAGMADETGVTVVRYNELDPEKFKSGTYEYCTDAADEILRLDLPGGKLPNTDHGTYVKHVEYELSSYSRSAHEPKSSLHHLLNAALPDPVLPFWVEEARVERFPALKSKGKGERRGIYGLIARLKGRDTADYNDERTLNLGEDFGTITLRYFVLNDGQEPGAFVTPEQGLAFILNGQRQGTKDRYWVKRNTQLTYIWNRLIVIIDSTALTSAAKRELFASTREQTKDSPLARRILDRVIDELKNDDELVALDELARERALAKATEETSEKVKKQLANKISNFIQGKDTGKKGGAKTPKKASTSTRKKPKPRNTDDSAMLEVPDTLQIVNEQPIKIHPGKTAAVIIKLNAKNGFLPTHAQALNVVIGSELKDKVRLRSTGKLVGGIARLTLEADADAPVESLSTVTVTLIEPSLGLVLTDQGKVEVAPSPKQKDSTTTGGGPDISIKWIGRAGWEDQTPVWDEDTAGTCDVIREEVNGEKDVVVRAEWVLNEDFSAWESVKEAKRNAGAKVDSLTDAYMYPLCWGLFEQAMAEWKREREADENGENIEVDDVYVIGERTRLARAILMAMAPEVALAGDEE
jgi:hypothetical protein